MTAQHGRNRSPHIDDYLKHEDARTSDAALPKDEQNTGNGRTSETDAPAEDVSSDQRGGDRA